MITRYDRIDKATLSADKKSFKDQYILTGADVPPEFEVDMVGNYDFNTEYDILDREKVCDIRSLDDVMAFIKEHNIETPVTMNLVSADGIVTGMLVGGEKDCMILSDLSSDWMENLQESDKSRDDYE